jgi:hypothetical protein
MKEYSNEDLIGSLHGPWVEDSIEPGFFRPVFVFFNWIDYNLYGTNAFGYHLTNFIFHILNSVLVFFMIYLLYRKDSFVAFLSSLMFSVLPYTAMAVGHASDRGTPIGFAFISLAFVFFLIYNGYVKERRYVFFSCVFFVLGLLTKEIIAVFPLLISFYLLIFKFKKIKDYLFQLGLYWGILVVYLIYRGIMLAGFNLGTFSYATSLFSDILVKVATFVANLVFLFLPFAEIEVNVFFYIVNLLFLGLFFYMLIKTIFDKKVKSFDKKMIFFLIGWIVIVLLPSYAVLGSRLLYFPAAAFSGLIILLAKLRIDDNKKAVFGILVLFVLFSLVGNFIMQSNYQDDSKFSLARDIYAYETQYEKGLLNEEHGELLRIKLESLGIVVEGEVVDRVVDDRNTLRKFLTRKAEEMFGLKDIREYNK